MPATGPGEEGPDYAERIAANADVEQGAWQRTLEDMADLESELEEEGWNVVSVGASHTAPTNPDVGETDRWGFVHVIPDNHADEFEAAVETGGFPRYRVFRNEMGSRVFMVTQLLDPDSGTAILIASNFEIRHAPGLVTTAMEEGHVLTHVQTLDGTHLGSFRHDDLEKFFPEPRKYANWNRSEDEEAVEDGDDGA